MLFTNAAGDGTQSEALGREAKLLRELNENLHALSQPITVLLCALEYGNSVGSIVEVKEMVKISQEASERLREIAGIMRDKVRDAIKEKAASPSSLA